ncbi:hypothetical protein NHX12_005974 [Muraenolepis orangiensis]|uniref:Transcription initiation factor TFIID component TAF4 C-terminal domain-containing protein n=1 Tax=Muraenolepis orangiensis TaxID=630683 RepID=A0A9Q0DRN2_9TELE|nr:hypothetical protein NHX12_005974 [Muraenolepis orangiensis]
MQQQAQTRQRDANLTALAAIGPRKKRKMDSPSSGPSGSEVRTHPRVDDRGAPLCTHHLMASSLFTAWFLEKDPVDPENMCL